MADAFLQIVVLDCRRSTAVTDTHEKIERRWILDQFENATFEIDVVHRLNAERLQM